MNPFTVHTRTRYGVYRLVGAFNTRSQALEALSDEVLKGIMATAWIRFEDGDKVYDWDHEHDTIADALQAASAAI